MWETTVVRKMQVSAVGAIALASFIIHDFNFIILLDFLSVFI